MFRRGGGDNEARKGRLADSHARSIRQLDAVQIPLYGLPPSWPGVRVTGATSFERGVTRDDSGPPITDSYETVELVHEDGPRRLWVESSNHVGSIDNSTLADLLESHRPEFSTLPIVVEGRSVDFAAARHGDQTVARWVGDGLMMTVTGEHWPMRGLELARITDLTPYYEGRARRLEQFSGYDLF